MEIEVEGKQGKLLCYLSQSSSKVKHAGQGSQVLVVSFGMPVAKPLEGTDLFHKELVERLANQSGWTVVSVLCSGVDGSAGRFSPASWCEDIEATAKYLVDTNKVKSVLLAGYDLMANICLCVGSKSDLVRGVATISPLVTISQYRDDPEILLERARQVGVKVPKGGAGLEKWREQLSMMDLSLSAVGMDSKQWLLIHGRDDEVVNELDVKSFLSATTTTSIESHLLTAGDHQLVTDPRMMAILLGWMERNS